MLIFFLVYTGTAIKYIAQQSTDYNNTIFKEYHVRLTMSSIASLMAVIDSTMIRGTIVVTGVRAEIAGINWKQTNTDFNYHI